MLIPPECGPNRVVSVDAHGAAMMARFSP